MVYASDGEAVIDFDDQSEKIARDLMRLNQELSHRYPGVVFVMLSSVPVSESQHKMGMSSNLENPEMAMSFLRMMLYHQEQARTLIVPPRDS